MNYFAHAPTSGRAGRTISPTGHSHVATLKPTTPLRPLMQDTVKPPSPLLAPQQQPLKPVTPLQPKNTPKTPISHPQRRWRFQLRLGLREQRRWRFQLRLGLREQRRWRFQLAHLTGPQRRQGFQPDASSHEQRRHRFQTTTPRAATNPLPRKLACNSIG